MTIYFTSDLHLCHDKDFLYEPRGFDNIVDHDIAIINNINNRVKEDDELYILGDLMLNDTDKGIEEFNNIKCKNIHVILGNHDTDNKIEIYKTRLPNVISIAYADRIKFGKYHFYLSHFRTDTTNEDKHLSEQLLNLHGHIHTKEKFYNNIYYNYNVVLDANNNMPISIEEILEAIRQKKSLMQP